MSQDNFDTNRIASLVTLPRTSLREIWPEYAFGAVTMPTQASAKAAVSWLLRGLSRSEDGGMPSHFDLKRRKWARSYPETTGYLIPTLLSYGQNIGSEEIIDKALGMADYLLEVQTYEGAIPGPGPHIDGGPPVYVFDTGQVLQGWLAAWETTGLSRYKQAAIRSGNWLTETLGDDGAWHSYQFGGKPKSYDARVGWILIQAGQKMQKPSWIAAGRRVLNWVVTMQDPDGWFSNCWLEPNEPIVTHTIAYVVEGLLEAAELVAEERFLNAARLAADALLARQEFPGHLSSDWSRRWHPLSRAACLAGDAQMAQCWLRLYQATGEVKYREAGRRALTAVASAQFPEDSPPDLSGAFSGSRPVWGRYLSWKLPNWASKFFLDAWHTWQAIENRPTNRAALGSATRVSDPSFPPVACVVLNWSNAAETIECLASLKRQIYPNMQILVVDNGSRDDSPSVISSSFPTVPLVETGCNLGYAGGNNLGIREALARGAEFIFLLNNDVSLAPNTVSQMVAAMQKNEEAAIASPMILEHNRPDRIWALGCEIDLVNAVDFHLHEGELDNGQLRVSESVDMAAGTALFIRSQSLDSLGLMNEGFFMYYEETDWCVKARRAGHDIITVPSAKVWHKVSASLDPLSPAVTYYMTRNSLRFLVRALPTRTQFQPVFRLIGRSLWQAFGDARRARWSHGKARLLGLVDCLGGNFGPRRTYGSSSNHNTL